MGWLPDCQVIWKSLTATGLNHINGLNHQPIIPKSLKELDWLAWLTKCQHRHHQKSRVLYSFHRLLLFLPTAREKGKSASSSIRFDIVLKTGFNASYSRMANRPSHPELFPATGFNFSLIKFSHYF